MSTKFKTSPRPRPATVPAPRKGTKPVAKEIAPTLQNSLDTPPAPTVPSDINNPVPTAPQPKDNVMNLVKDNKERKGNGKSAHYHIEGLRGSVKISSTIFGAAGAPATLTLDGEGFAVPGTKVGETKEERKARLAALPKLTAAEKLQELEEKVARAKAKLNASM